MNTLEVKSSAEKG